MRENGRNYGDLRPQIDSRKTSTSDSNADCLARVGKGLISPIATGGPMGLRAPSVRNKEEDVGGNSVAREVNNLPARKLGSFTQGLNPPLWPGLPGDRLTNEWLRAILIRIEKGSGR